jgi:(p)ppGpp synthase/HD superfamily hydrolase
MTEKVLSILDYIRSKVVHHEEVIHARIVAELTKEFSADDRIYTIALLHDVVEDGYASFEKLQKWFNLDAEQMSALDAITRRQGERYFDYIERCKQNEMAKTVKLADLQHNISRCANDLPNRWGLLRRYAKAYGMLIGEWKEKGK